MLETHNDAFDNLINHQITSIGHFDQIIKKFDLASILVLKNKLDIHVFVLEASEIFPIVLQVQSNELKTSRIDINITFDSIFKLILTLIEKINNHLQ